MQAAPTPLLQSRAVPSSAAARPATPRGAPEHVPRILGPSSAATQPKSVLQQKWEAERGGSGLAISRQRLVTKVFRKLGAADTLRSVECRKTLCKLTLDEMRIVQASQLQAAAARFSGTFAIVDASADGLIALVAITTIERMARQG